ncbi:P-loop ATPase, Sll1717 family [Streptomyces sp. NPDC002533]
MQLDAGPVSRLFFGRDDAETDLRDGLLKGPVFRPTYAYREALSGRKSLVIGRKGSGKSAICRHLAGPDGHPGASVLIAPDDAAGDEIRRFELQGLTPDTAKSLIWRYLFAVHAARHLTGHARAAHGRRLPGSVRAVRSFLEANGESDDARLYERLRRGVGRLQSADLSLKAFGFEAALGIGGASEGAEASRQLDVLEAGVQAGFADLGCARLHPPLLLLVDQLEQVWTVEPESHALVTGLLLAAKHTMSFYDNAVRTALFIRADIYDTLNFGDGDKFHSDEIRISWTREALEDLALHRARASLEAPLTKQQLWEDLFPASVKGEPTSEYILRHSLPRPRDTIQFLNVCRDFADEAGNFTITERDVLAATDRFSGWKLQDLAKEYLISHPFLRSLFVMFENAGYVVMRAALEDRFEACKRSLHLVFSDYTESLTTQGVIDVLYGVGFIGVKRGNDIVYAGGSATPPLPDEDEFHMHPCFRTALNCLGAMELPTYRPGRARNPVVGHSSLAAAITAADVGLTVNRNVRLLNEVTAAGERLLRQLTRSGLPDNMREEVYVEIARVVAVAEEIRSEQPDGGRRDVPDHVLAAAVYLDALATRLAAHGFRDRTVTRGLEDESRALIRSLGGSLGGGGGGGSDSG